MNKLHEALKNEELMLEVGRKATEEQKAMTQSTVEERFDAQFEEIILDQEVRKVVPGIKHFIKSELQLAEQQAYQLGKEANAPYFHERCDLLGHMSRYRKVVEHR